MLKTMKSEMLTITKKNPDISVLHVYSQTLITGGTTQQNIKPWKADFWEIAPHLPSLLHPAPPASPKNCNMPSNPPLPIYSPSSPSDVSSNTALQISVQELNSISNLPTPDHNLTPSRNTTVPQTTPAQTSGQYPLKAELSALCELVDSVRVDLLQTSMIVNYIQDCLKSYN